MKRKTNQKLGFTAKLIALVFGALLILVAIPIMEILAASMTGRPAIDYRFWEVIYLFWFIVVVLL